MRAHTLQYNKRGDHDRCFFKWECSAFCAQHNTPRWTGAAATSNSPQLDDPITFTYMVEKWIRSSREFLSSSSAS